jgi:glycosyl transferase family 11
MIFFYGEGRLGNQIFQYQALSRIAKPAERIVSVGLEDLQRILELCGPPISVLTRSGTIKRLLKYGFIPFVLRPIAKNLRLINYACESLEGAEPHRGQSGRLTNRAGMFRRLTFVDGGYYHNPSFWPSMFPADSIVINAALRRSAREYVESIGRGRRPSFVHVRRGDYIGYSSYGLGNLELPAGFYRSAIRELEQRIGSTPLVFVTDDPTWVEDTFADIPHKTVASFSPAMDFAIMTECGSGVVSNSSFSLAAAFMMTSPDLVIAPRYWLGFRVGQWYPPRIQAIHERLLFLPVLSDALAA